MPYQYNVILGRVALNKFGAIPHHAYLCLKIPAAAGVITIYGDQGLSRRIEETTTSAIRYVHDVAPTGSAPRLDPPSRVVSSPGTSEVLGIGRSEEHTSELQSRI